MIFFRKLSKINTVNTKKQIFLLSSILAMYSCQTLANNCNCECNEKQFYQKHKLLAVKPELGIDIGFVRTQFKKDHGDKLLNRTQVPINVFLGLNFTKHFGLELGYTETRGKHKKVHLGPGEYAPGADRITLNHYQIYDTTLSLSQPYCSLTFKQPIKEKLQLFGAIGVAAMKMNAKWENIEDTGMLPSITASAGRNKTIILRKTIPLIKAGAYYQITNSFSLRFSTTWLQTSKLKYSIQSHPILNTSMNLYSKNSIQYSIGFIYII